MLLKRMIIRYIRKNIYYFILILGSEMKARMYRSPEVIEAEKMLDQLALNLKKSEVKRVSLIF